MRAGRRCLLALMLWKRRILANIYYLRRPTLEFLPVLGGMTAIVFLGGLAFRHLYHQPLTYSEALYHTYCLIFMEHLLDFPKHLLLQVLFFALPPLGLAVILDGIVRFSYHILSRDERSPEWVSAMSKTMKRHVILFGLGKLGLRVLQQLIRLNELVIVVERDPNNPNIAYAHRQGVPVRVGNGREEGLLCDLNVEQAKSLIMATNDDLVNLEVAIDARKIRPEIRVVLRMFDQELAEKIRDSFDIHLALSAWELAAPVFATASSDRRIVNSFYVGEKLMVVAEMEIAPGSSLVGMSVMDMHETGVLVLEVARGEVDAYFPSPGHQLAAGDRVTVQCEPARLRKMTDGKPGKAARPPG